jgi:hypothetical protein
MNIEKLTEIIEEVNNGNWEEYSQYFNNDMELFIKVITKYGLIDLIDPMSNDLSDYQNDILYVLVNENPEKWINFICESVINSDITKEGDSWYLHLNDQEDLGDLFYHGNRESTRNLVKSVLGEDSWEPYWDTTDDVYRDVVEELNDENLKVLYSRILKEVDMDFINEDFNRWEKYVKFLKSNNDMNHADHPNRYSHVLWTKYLLDFAFLHHSILNCLSNVSKA